jgi:hypothetical protein
VFPPAKIALEAQALGDLKCSDQATLDLLSAFAGSIASWAVFPARPVEVSGEFAAVPGSAALVGRHPLRHFELAAVPQYSVTPVARKVWQTSLPSLAAKLCSRQERLRIKRSDCLRF